MNNECYKCNMFKNIILTDKLKEILGIENINRSNYKEALEIVIEKIFPNLRVSIFREKNNRISLNLGVFSIESDFDFNSYEEGEAWAYEKAIQILLCIYAEITSNDKLPDEDTVENDVIYRDPKEFGINDTIFNDEKKYDLNYILINNMKNFKIKNNINFENANNLDNILISSDLNAEASKNAINIDNILISSDLNAEASKNAINIDNILISSDLNAEASKNAINIDQTKEKLNISSLKGNTILNKDENKLNLNNIPSKHKLKSIVRKYVNEEHKYIKILDDFIKNYCIYMPELEIIKENDVYSYRILFQGINFVSSYEKNKLQAKNDLCKKIFEYIYNNWNSIFIPRKSKK